MVKLVHDILPSLIASIELIGILVVSVACLRGFIDYVICSFSKKSVDGLRHNLGISMVIGLEFKMAAEILRTVLVRDLNEIVMLGGIIILRAILAHLIKLDIKDECMGCDKKPHKN